MWTPPSDSVEASSSSSTWTPPTDAVEKSSSLPPLGQQAALVPDQFGRVDTTPPKPYKEPSLEEKVIGLGEATRGIIQGAVAVPAAAITGVMAKLEGNDPNAQVDKTMSNLSYTPKTQAGKDYLQSVGDFMQNLPAILPEVGEAGAITSGIKGAKVLAKGRKVADIPEVAKKPAVTLAPEKVAEPSSDVVPTIGDKVQYGKMPDDTGSLLARHYRNEDGTTSHILLDPEEIKKSYDSSGPENKPWIKEHFQTAGEYQDFIKEHELAHAENPQHEGESTLDYEKRINAIALNKVKTIKETELLDNPAINTSRLNLGVPENPKDVQNQLYAIGKNDESDVSELTTNVLKPALKDGVDLPMEAGWREHVEEGKPLSEKSQTLYDKYMKPVLSEIKALTKQIQDKGWAVPTELSESFMGRTLIPKKRSAWEAFKGKLTGGSLGGFDQNIEAAPGSAKERGLFVAEFPSGQRLVVQKKGNDLIQWNKGKAAKFKKDAGEIKAGTQMDNFTVKEATQAELEKHTPYRYNKASLITQVKKLQELRKFYRAKQAIENLKNSKYFREVAHKINPNEPIPDGYSRPQHIDKLPELDGYAFPDNLSHIIEDFAKKFKPNALTTISSVLIKNMMLNPLPHMLNEAWHVYNARGLTGWVNPVAIHRFVKTGMPAIRSVVKQDDHFRALLDNGASLLSANVRNDAFQSSLMEKGMREFVDTPEAKTLMEKYGMAPLDLYNAISKKSGEAMWVMRDSMYVQLINEKMALGMNMKEAITDVERHMPAYKLPTTVLKSRELSKMLQNPNVSVFSRYHYGVVKSLVNTAEDLTGKRGLKEFAHGVDTAAAIAVAISVLYPLQDKLAEKLTGNPNATTRRAGPYHIIEALWDVSKGTKQPYSALSSVLTFNPALLAGAQFIADRQLYNGQPIYHPQDDWKDIAHDVGRYWLETVPQVSTTLQVSGESGGGLPQFVAKQLDIVSPSWAQVQKQKMMQRKARSEAINRKKRDIMKKIYGGG